MASYEATMLKLEKMAQANTATQMNWQEKMSRSSHQMEVADLVKAGLNPVLSAGGNGAQSYTTSVDSAVNGIAGMASAREGANATKFAARQSAAATRAAAAAQLAAAREAAAASRYVADRNYSANQYGWQQKAKIQEGINRTTLETIDKQPPKNISGLIWKAFDQTGLRKATVNSKLIGSVTNMVKTIGNNPMDYFRNVKNNTISAKNFVLNSNGVRVVNTQLSKMALSPTYRNQKLFIKAFVFHDFNAVKQIGILMKSKMNSSRYSTLR